MSIGSHGITDQDLEWKTTVLFNETVQASNDAPIRHQPNSFLTRVHLEKDVQFRRFKTYGLPSDIDINEFGEGILLRNFNLNALPELPKDSWDFSGHRLAHHKEGLFLLRCTESPAPEKKPLLGFMLHGRSTEAHSADLWLNDKSILGPAEWIGGYRISI